MTQFSFILEGLYKARIAFGGGVLVACPEDLIRMKQNTGRSVDERDVALLEELIERRRARTGDE